MRSLVFDQMSIVFDHMLTAEMGMTEQPYWGELACLKHPCNYRRFGSIRARQQWEVATWQKQSYRLVSEHHSGLPLYRPGSMGGYDQSPPLSVMPSTQHQLEWRLPRTFLIRVLAPFLASREVPRPEVCRIIHQSAVNGHWGTMTSSPTLRWDGYLPFLLLCLQLPIASLVTARHVTFRR